MKVNELIALLQTMPQDAYVVVFDHEKNLYHADDEPNGDGLYDDFEVELNPDIEINNGDHTDVPVVTISFKSNYEEVQEEIAEWCDIAQANNNAVNDAEKFTPPSYVTGGTIPDSNHNSERYVIPKQLQKQQCYKGHGACDCPGTCRENC